MMTLEGILLLRSQAEDASYIKGRFSPNSICFFKLKPGKNRNHWFWLTNIFYLSPHILACEDMREIFRRQVAKSLYARVRIEPDVDLKGHSIGWLVWITPKMPSPPG